MTPVECARIEGVYWRLVTQRNIERKAIMKTDKTTAPIEVPPLVAQALVPEFVRLPRVGTECPHTGLRRSKINELILPSELNAGKPPVKSFVLRRKGSRTGVRLIDYKSLVDYIRAHPQEV